MPPTNGPTIYLRGDYRKYGQDEDVPGQSYPSWRCNMCGELLAPTITGVVTVLQVDNHYLNDCSFFHATKERDTMATVTATSTPPTYDGNIHNWGKPDSTTSGPVWRCKCGANIHTSMVTEVAAHYTDGSCSLFSGPTASDAPKPQRPKTCWDTIDLVLPHAKRVLLYGPPGTGKTHAGVYQGLNEGQDVYSIYITEYTAVSEPRGNIFPVVRDGQRVYEWQDGPATIAYRHGHRLVINEIDKASDDCMTFFLALLDDSAVSRITLPTGEVVPRHPNFACVATMNARPIALIDPLRDRFPVTINVDIVNPRAVEQLPEAMRETAAATANNKTLEDRLGIRAWLEFVHLREHIGDDVAAGLLFGKKANQVLTAVRAKEASLSARDQEAAGAKVRKAKAEAVAVPA